MRNFTLLPKCEMGELVVMWRAFTVEALLRRVLAIQGAKENVCPAKQHRRPISELGSTKILIQIGLFSYCLSKTNLVSSFSSVNRFPLRLIVNVSVPTSNSGIVELVTVVVIVEPLIV